MYVPKLTRIMVPERPHRFYIIVGKTGLPLVLHPWGYRRLLIVTGFLKADGAINTTLLLLLDHRESVLWRLIGAKSA